MPPIDAHTFNVLRQRLNERESLFTTLPGYTGLGIGWEGGKFDGRYVIVVMLRNARAPEVQRQWAQLPSHLLLATETGEFDLPVRAKTVGVLRAG